MSPILPRPTDAELAILRVLWTQRARDRPARARVARAGSRDGIHDHAQAHADHGGEGPGHPRRVAAHACLYRSSDQWRDPASAHCRSGRSRVRRIRRGPRGPGAQCPSRRRRKSSPKSNSSSRITRRRSRHEPALISRRRSRPRRARLPRFCISSGRARRWRSCSRCGSSAGRPRSHARYTAGVVTLAAMLVAPVATFAWIASAQRVAIDRRGAGCANVAGAGATVPPDSTRLEVGPEPLTQSSAIGVPGRITPAVQSAVARHLVRRRRRALDSAARRMGRRSPARDAGGAAGLGGAARARPPDRRPAGARPCRVGPRVVAGCASPSSSVGSNRWCCFRPPRSRACRLHRSKRFWRTSWRTSDATTISSISCSPPSKRCCSITRRSGGSRVRCGPSASIAVTTSRSRCAIASSTSVRFPIWRG